MKYLINCCINKYTSQSKRSSWPQLTGFRKRRLFFISVHLADDARSRKHAFQTNIIMRKGGGLVLQNLPHSTAGI